LPILLLLVLAVAGVVGWIVYGVAHPPRRPYLVTPEKFSQVSDRGLKVTDETWPNRDQTQARGWLLRGDEGAPAVILLHRYGADRSWLLNLGVKLNETTNYTVLWPDLRGHGLEPSVTWTSFGTREAEDVAASLDYLRSLKTPQGRPLVGQAVGLYGVELGAYAALEAATHDAGARALALDSVPAAPDDLLHATVRERLSMDNAPLQALTRWGARIYFYGHYENATACAAAQSLTDRRVLLLTGEEAGYLRDSTVALAQCFPNQTSVELKSDLPLTGFNLPSATGEQGEAYDRRVIDFFDRSLRATP
jgi:pimeloyl-ACP methyl ester carboxylesterase